MADEAYIYTAMRIIYLVILFVLFSATAIVAREVPAYKHHTFELSVTPCFDYHFITYPKRVADYKHQVNNLYLPFAGVNVGVAYIYRPIKFMGISTGFNFVEYTIKMGKIDPAQVLSPTGGFVTTVVRFKGYLLHNYIDVPILIHGYYRFHKTELDIGTGPEFLFSALNVSHYTTTSDSNGVFDITDNHTQKFSATEMRKYSW